MLGRLLVCSVPATVLFDSGASHSFISKSFARLHDLQSEMMESPLAISSPGSKMSSAVRVPDVQIQIQSVPFSASLILLPSSDIDVILGMDWLVKYKAKIDCPSKTVLLTHDVCELIEGPTQLYALNAGVAPLV